VSDEQRRQPGCPARELGEESRFQGSNNPPAEPGAFQCEPLKAARRGR